MTRDQAGVEAQLQILSPGSEIFDEILSCRQRVAFAVAVIRFISRSNSRLVTSAPTSVSVSVSVGFYAEISVSLSLSGFMLKCLCLCWVLC